MVIMPAMPTPPALDLTASVEELTAALINIESVSGNEATLADMVHAALASYDHLELTRVSNSLVARTTLGHDERVIIAGHLDTAPVNDNLPAHVTADRIYGLGAADMKGGVAVALRLAAALTRPTRDITWIWYECEEVQPDRNGLGLIHAAQPQLLTGELAILMEPTNARIEAGCQGTLWAQVRTRGVRAHSARSWMGTNAIHASQAILQRLGEYTPAQPMVDGLRFHEGLNAVLISGGVATNVIPDECTVTVNYRFAPHRSPDEAAEFVRDFFTGFAVEVIEVAPGARPGLDQPAAAAFADMVGGQVVPKFGWTDVSRFSALGIPALNYGPADPLLAHTQGEYVPTIDLQRCETTLQAWLTKMS